jgi:hypothetical protein
MFPLSRIQFFQFTAVGTLVVLCAFASAAPMLAWLVKERGVSPHIPVFDKSWRDDGTLSRADFTYDAGQNLYVCPQGKLLGSGLIQTQNATMAARTTADRKLTASLS